MWVIRYGCHQLQTPLKIANDWILIGDVTISVGKLKCLATLGIRMSALKYRDNLTLTHKDMEILGLYPTESSTGEFVERAFEDSAKRIGGNFLALVLDQGSDVKRGARLFQANHPNTKILHDIAHKLSNIMEHELEHDVQWFKYIQQLNFTRRQVFQTELAALMPKKQREKGRFMDISHLVRWPERVRSAKASGNLSDIKEDRYRKYLWWIETDFINDLQVWGCMEKAVRMVKETIRTFGLSIDVYKKIKISLEEIGTENKRVNGFAAKVLNTVWEEVKKLDEKELLICSTEIIESVFGKYKAINEGLHGITGNILGICTFIGGTKNITEVKTAMESCSASKAAEYMKSKFGQTLSSLRRRYFPSIKRTKFDKTNICAA